MCICINITCVHTYICGHTYIDLHVQRDYQYGAETECGQPVCCRSEDGAGRPGHRAGAFGDYNCDASPLLLKSMGKALRKLDVIPDFVLKTGSN